MICFPNAKVNIGLNVTEKREDGYHNIESIFYPIPYKDVLEIIPSEHFSFTSHGLEILGKPESNLVVKAFELMKKRYSIPNVEIHLIKSIPMGAGLGGGSADAAFTLKTLNQLFEINLSTNQLEELALELGSDCPFFIENKPKFVSGRGEKMEAVDFDISNKWMLIISPDINISTQEAYSMIIPKKSQSNLKKSIHLPIQEWSNLIQNDFQTSEFEKYPELRNLYHSVQKQALYTSLTGSGSSIYGIFNDQSDFDTGYSQKWLKL